jgi:hypothetical protein
MITPVEILCEIWKMQDQIKKWHNLNMPDSLARPLLDIEDALKAAERRVQDERSKIMRRL